MTKVYDEVGFIPGMQGQFNIHNSQTNSQPIDQTVNTNNHTTISRHTKKASHKIKHSFMIRGHKQIDSRRTVANILKTHDKPMAIA